VSVTPLPRFTPRERTPSTHWTGGWVDTRAGLDTEATEKIILPLPGIEPRSPSRPVRSQDTILSYPGSLSFLLVYKNYNSAFHCFTREPLSIINIQKLSGINILAMVRLLSEQYSLQPYSYPFDTVDVELLGRKALWCCST
jgi:hypothetical protein